MNGRLCGGVNCGTGNANNPIILTPTTANLQQKFADKVNVGTNGGTETGFEGAMQALTPPNITGENAGFLRYDANLAIVVVSDAGDQGGQPYSYYPEPVPQHQRLPAREHVHVLRHRPVPAGPDAETAASTTTSMDSATYGQTWIRTA